MKILHIDPERGFGGGERQVLGLVRHLAVAGHENLLAAPPGSSIAARVPPGDARLLPLSIRNDLDLLAALRFARLLRRERPEVIHYHTARAHKLAALFPTEAHRSIVTRRMDYDLSPGLLTDLLYNRRVAAVVAISSDVRRRLLAAGVREERIILVPSGVEAPEGFPTGAGRSAARGRFGAGEGDWLVATVAALEHRKGIDVLLDSLALPAGRRLRLVVAGDGSRRVDLERRAVERGVADRIVFLGERSQVADLLAAADAFALPSRREGLGVAVLEAMAMGLPVVASRVGGISDAVVEGETGWLVRAEDPGSLAEALARLAQAPETAREMGRRGRERVRERFTMAGMAGAYEALYGRIADVAEAVPMGDNRAR